MTSVPDVPRDKPLRPAPGPRIRIRVTDWKKGLMVLTMADRDYEMAWEAAVEYGRRLMYAAEAYLGRRPNYKVEWPVQIAPDKQVLVEPKGEGVVDPNVGPLMLLFGDKDPAPVPFTAEACVMLGIAMIQQARLVDEALNGEGIVDDMKIQLMHSKVVFRLTDKGLLLRLAQEQAGVDLADKIQVTRGEIAKIRFARGLSRMPGTPTVRVAKPKPERETIVINSSDVGEVSLTEILPPPEPPKAE